MRWITLPETKTEGLEGWLGALLLSWKTQVQFPADEWLTTPSHSSPRGPTALFQPRRAPGTQGGAQTHMQVNTRARK